MAILAVSCSYSLIRAPDRGRRGCKGPQWAGFQRVAKRMSGLAPIGVQNGGKNELAIDFTRSGTNLLAYSISRTASPTRTIPLRAGAA